MLTKAFEAQVKADAGDEPGTFEALVSVFNTVDLVGDRVMPGAFDKTIQAWRKSRDPIPVILSHNWNDVEAHIGIADPNEVKATKEGLVVKGQLDIDTNPVAAAVYRHLKRRSIKAFSFGYTVGKEREGEDGANELQELSLIEVGPTLKGAHPDAGLREVKSAVEEVAEDKAVWSTAFINDLPDSSFLYIESGGEKDEEGKTTPRSLRHFPYKDSSGNVDLPHLRNALSRIPQSSLPQAVKDRIAATARRILDAQTASDEPEGKTEDDTELEERRPADPLRKRTEAMALEVALGRNPKQVPAEAVEDEPEPEREPLDSAALRRQTEQSALDIALGG